MKERQRWQPEEDALLRAYVKQYGPKEWNLISQRMGKPIDRDPKSCLERWKNYLKPGIKKGSLTPDEQSLVISLQAKYGNKWKKIAAEVPGRTAKRLGKWWEVFKEKQLKQLQKSSSSSLSQSQGNRPAAAAAVDSPEKAARGKYDHILDTFAEKYVQPNKQLFAFQSPMNVIVPVPVPVPDPPPVLSLGSVPMTAEPACSSGPGAPYPWMNTSGTPTATSSLTSSSSSTTPSPSVSLTLSPSEPAVLDPIHPDPSRFFPAQQVAILIQHCRELEEGRERWARHKKEATWRLSRLEQQLEAEKARRMKEKTEEVEGKIRRLREEEAAFVSRLEGECREGVRAARRDGEAEEAKLMEALCSNHVKLAKLIQRIGGPHTY